MKIGSSSVGRIFSPLEESIPKNQRNALARGLLALLVVYSVIRGIVAALWRPLWYDELFTLSIAGQPSLRDWWRAIKAGFDSAPPAFYLVERAALHVSSHTELALRLPSILAFAFTLICVFVYAKKQNCEIAALLCAISLLPTLLFHTYAIEARAYSMVIACLAFALVCYQRTPSRRWVALFGLALVVAELLHYYAVFAMIPFWIAEGVALLRGRRFRWSVWLALACGTLPLIVFFPLLWRIKTNYGPHMFALPIFGELKGYYARFFLLSEQRLGIALALLAVVGVLWSFLGGETETEASEKGSAPETALLVSFVALPYAMYVLLEAVHGILLNRYALITTLAIALGVVSAFSMAGRRAIAIYGILVVCIAGLSELIFWQHQEHDSLAPYFSATSAKDLDAMRQSLEKAGHPDLPIVVGSCLLHAQFVYYFEPELKNRMVYLVDPERELKVARTDSSSRTQLAFSKFFPLRVANFTEFTATHKEFIYYAMPADWDTPIFTSQGYSMQVLNPSAYGLVFLVQPSEGSPL